MRIAVSLTASIAVHVAVVLVLAVVDEPPAPRAATTTRRDAAAPRVEFAEIVPVDVVLLPEPVAPAVAPPLDVSPVAPAPSRQPAAPGPAIAAMTDRTGPPVSETAPVVTGPAGPTGTSLMTMRRPGRDVALAPGAHASALERIAAADRPLPVDPTTGDLDPNGGGRTIRRETVFTARVERDGTVDIEDAKNLRFYLKIPRPSKIGKALGDHLDEWAKDPYALAKKGGDREPPNIRKKEEVDGKDDKRTPTIIPLAGATFDVSDWAERVAGNDPYASRKLDFMDRTRDERVRMGERERQRQRDATEQTVRRHLTRLWARPDLSMAQKKEALFELWDDCAESDDPGDGEAGARARNHVLGFIRGKLPAGSEHAYTEAELARLDARRQSKAHFAPYQSRSP